MGLDKLFDHHHRQLNRKAWNDLRGFIDTLSSTGQLKPVPQPVSPRLQVTALCHRSLKKNGPALLFENLQGFEMPVLGNLFGTQQRVLAALNHKTPDRVPFFYRDVPEVEQRLLKDLSLDTRDDLLKLLWDFALHHIIHYI